MDIRPSQPFESFIDENIQFTRTVEVAWLKRRRRRCGKCTGASHILKVRYRQPAAAASTSTPSSQPPTAKIKHCSTEQEQFTIPLLEGLKIHAVLCAANF